MGNLDHNQGQGQDHPDDDGVSTPVPAKVPKGKNKEQGGGHWPP